MYSKNEMILWSMIYSMVNKIGRVDFLVFSPNSLFKIFKKSLELEINIFESNYSEIENIFKDIEENKSTEKIKSFFKDSKILAILKNQVIDELKLIEEYNIKTTTYLCEDYPEKLRKTKLPPYVIYYTGILPKNSELLDSISIVGTRYPKDTTLESFAREILKKVNVKYNISGLASGCDSIGHKVTIENKIKNIAVLGQGLSTNIYPSENSDLANQIIKEKGAIISEIPPSLSVKGIYLLQRNRLQVYFSDSLIVLESKKKGGTITTIKYALEEEKKIYIKKTASMIEIFKKIKKKNRITFIEKFEDLKKESELKLF